MSKYTELLKDIELDSQQKRYRNLADIIIDSVEDDIQQIALLMGKEYFPNDDWDSDEYMDEFLTPLADKIWDAVLANLGYAPRE